MANRLKEKARLDPIFNGLLQERYDYWLKTLGYEDNVKKQWLKNHTQHITHKNNKREYRLPL
ncbi:hypothetical protein VCRA2121O157_160013 [Vibrio crassostreae]|nr:hypothetical protein VCRA2113O138_150101 [Vibrio crassostreae]CAK1785304.1 hypothetical protein VCRA2113O140_160013 [Vibrio crassostreae]CAK1835697.1 hypothetical protein VCRA2113O137_190013 [Vibrio crassostreae]CAK2274728.1 hypothetical protein VCRA2116O141_150098 [Vibrio crassostreae]CAK2649013.1 hypothetical protein VCRA2119O148_150101 [Vibrio crassostreae]